MDTVRINWSEVYALAQSGSSAAEISAKLGVGTATLHRRCVAELGMHLEELVDREDLAGRATLRLSQYSTAVKDKNPQMQIWLGKNRLGQSDKSQVQHEGAQAAQVIFYGENKPMTWEEEQRGENTCI